MKYIIQCLVLINLFISCESDNVKEEEQSETEIINNLIFNTFKEYYYWKYDLENKEVNKKINTKDFFKSLLNKRDLKKGFSHIDYVNSNSIADSVIGLDTVYNIEDKKIGYLLYNEFNKDHDYMEQLNQVFEKFRAKPIDELILDLRYNGRGNLLTTSYLAAMITDKYKGKEFFVYKDINNTLTGTTSLIKYNFLKLSEGFLTIYPLNLNRLIIITSHFTALASEVLINSFKGLNFPIILIGEKTYGKEMSGKHHKIWHYDLFITQNKVFNIKNQSIPQDGFNPNIYIKLNEKDIGNINEPMLNKALNYIKSEKL